MYINCRHCRALVATDPVSDLPPLRCPRCRGVLRTESPAPATAPSVATLLRPSAPAADPRTAKTARDDTAEAQATPLAGESGTGMPHDAADDAAATPSLPAVAIHERVHDNPPLPHGGADETAQSVADADTTDDSSPPMPAHPDVSADAVASAPRSAARASPTFARAAAHRTTPSSRRQQRWLLVAVTGLTLLLALQVLLADRARLAGDPDWRPVLTTLCGVLGCALPPWHEPEALTLLARDVRPDPDAPGLLQVSATFRNDARWAQAWPRVLLTLSDLDGRVAGTRAFDPSDYLDTGERGALLDASQSATILLSIVEPEQPAVSFSFEFR